MPLADFIHLKVRSAYSLTEGANKVDKVVALAKENAMPAVAVTDRNNLFGALEFSQYAAKAGIQPIVGCDLGVRREEEGGIATSGKPAAADWEAKLKDSKLGDPVVIVPADFAGIVSLLEVAEAGLEAEAIRDRRQDVGHGRHGVVRRIERRLSHSMGPLVYCWAFTRSTIWVPLSR